MARKKNGWYHNRLHMTGLPWDHDCEQSDDENISVYDAAEIWRDSGKDEDNTFGYSTEELEDALNS